jgi:hypothetical protein
MASRTHSGPDPSPACIVTHSAIRTHPVEDELEAQGGHATSSPKSINFNPIRGVPRASLGHLQARLPVGASVCIYGVSTPSQRGKACRLASSPVSTRVIRPRRTALARQLIEHEAYLEHDRGRQRVPRDAVRAHPGAPVSGAPPDVFLPRGAPTHPRDVSTRPRSVAIRPAQGCAKRDARPPR